MSQGSRLKTLLLESTLEDARRAAVAAREFFREAGVPESDESLLELAVSEAASNIVRHAYEGRPGQPMIVKLFCDGETLRIVLRDRGTAMSPERLARSEMPEPFGEISPHGRGLAIMALAVDDISYTSEQGWNEMTLTRKIDSRECRI